MIRPSRRLIVNALKCAGSGLAIVGGIAVENVILAAANAVPLPLIQMAALYIAPIVAFVGLGSIAHKAGRDVREELTGMMGNPQKPSSPPQAAI